MILLCIAGTQFGLGIFWATRAKTDIDIGLSMGCAVACVVPLTWAAMDAIRWWLS